ARRAWLRRRARSAIGRSEDLQYFVTDQLPQRLATALARRDGIDDLPRRRHADVGHQQHFFEALERVGINRPRPLLGRITAPDEVVEALGNLLRRAGEPLLQLVEQTHECVPAIYAPSAFCLRPISSRRAEGGSF